MRRLQPSTVLAVDDEVDFATLTATFLEREDDRIDVLTATTAAEAIDQFLTQDVDCIVSDYDMPEMDGLTLLEEVRSIDAEIPFILFTGKGSEEVASQAISAGVTDYLQKKSGTDQYTLLANRIRNCVEQYQAERERELVIERMTDAIIEVDADWRLTTVDDHAEAIYEMDAEEMLGENLWDVFPEAVDTCFYDEYHRVMKSRKPTSLEEYYEPFALWFQVHVYPGFDGGLSIFFQDITKTANRD